MRYFLLALSFGVAALASNALAQQGSAPFCTVDSSGTYFQCNYYSMESCRAAAGLGGACIVNQQSQSTSNRNHFDFGSGNSVLSEAQRWRAPAPAASSATSQQQWLNMCRDMEQSYFNDLEDLRPRLSPPMTTEEYARLASRFRERGEYCRALARQ